MDKQNFSRRKMLAGGVAAAFAGGAHAQGTGAKDPLLVLGPDYPRGYFFRSSEAFAANRKITYEEWEKTFEQLMSIEGKALDEELENRSARNIEFFSRFKQRHPNQVVLLHFNGNARDPRYQTEKFAAGHWVYFNGTAILSDVPAEDGEIQIRVSDPSLFRTGIGRFKDCNEDIGLCALDAQGKPDWSASEQVTLISADTAGKSIRVRRGQYGSKPRAFAAGKAYCAAHVSEGPWGEKMHLLWYYNYAMASPKDAAGKSCSDILVEDVARRFDPNGQLAIFDGLEFDVLQNVVGGHDARRRGPDVDGDGKADGGMVNGVNSYGIGVFEFCRKLRLRMGAHRIIQADGMTERNQRAFGILNGIESEGFMRMGGRDLDDFSGGINRHLFWNVNAYPPVFNYINHKFTMPNQATGRPIIPDMPFSMHRLVLGAAQITDAAFCYSFAPKPEPGDLIGIWDELRMGTAKKLGWLGKPLGPMVRIAAQRPDVLEGKGVQRITAPDAALVKVGSGVCISAKKPGAELLFRIAGVPVNGPDLLVTLIARGEPMEGYPKQVARLVYASTSLEDSPRVMSWVNGKNFASGFYFRKIQGATVDLEFSVESSEPVYVSAVTAHVHPDAIYREFEYGAVLVNPTPREYTFDLGKLFAGKSFRRLKASPLQDTVANNGAAVAGSVTLQPNDGLFLIRNL